MDGTETQDGTETRVSRSSRVPGSGQLKLILVLGAALAAGLMLFREYGAGPGPLRQASVAAQPIAPRSELSADEQATIELFERAAPSVVYITNLGLRRDRFGLNVLEVPQGTGSGFLWDDRGHVVTNYHVLQGARRAEVTLSDQSTWSADLAGTEPDKDLAVLKIDAPREKLRPLAIGTSRDLRVGQKVLAIGNPFGLDHTLTTGIISALEREIRSITGRAIHGVIQTDAAINPGNSGGPLLDSAGRLIGVNTAIISPAGAYAGIGFAVPVDIVNRIVPQLVAHGRVTRPGIGVSIAHDRIAREFDLEGVLVIDVVPGSGAAKAGIRPTRRDASGRLQLGDVIVAVDGEPVRTADDLMTRLEEKEIGDRVRLTARRGERTEEVEVEIHALE